MSETEKEISELTEAFKESLFEITGEEYDITVSLKAAKRKDILSQTDSALILKSLTDNDFNVTKTALILGMKRSNLYSRMEHYDIHRPEKIKPDLPIADNSKIIKNSKIVFYILSRIPYYYETNFDQINVVSQKRDIVEVRMNVMYLILEFTTLSQKKIGAVFSRGGKPFDHSTVIHAKRTWQDIIDTEPKKRKVHSLFESDVRKYYETKI